MYTLSPGYRLPAIQRGLSPAEIVLAKVNAGAGAAILASAVISTPPIWALGAVAATAALINLSPGRRSIARWATVGARYWRERTTPSLASTPGTTRTWTLYPHHGTMQDPYRRAEFHARFAKALTFAAGQARTAGIQVHVTHHGVVGDYSDHEQTVSVHVPRGLVGHPERVIGTIEAELAALGVLDPATPAPVPAVTGRTSRWAATEDGLYVATARITSWPSEAGGDLMPTLLLSAADGGEGAGRIEDRSLSVLYRPLPARESRRSARWRDALAGAALTDRVTQDAHAVSSGSTHDALVQGDSLVDVDAYLTVRGDSAEEVMEAVWDVSLLADRHRLSLDWLTGQQVRAHVMTTPHGAPTRKGAVL